MSLTRQASNSQTIPLPIFYPFRQPPTSRWVLKKTGAPLELLYSLRSIDRHWTGAASVHVLGTSKERPGFLHPSRVGYHRTVGYGTAFKAAMRITEKAGARHFVWWNDDIFLMKPTRAADLLPPRHYEDLSRIDEGEKLPRASTSWRRKLYGVARELVRLGKPAWNYDGPHCPYLFNLDLLEPVFDHWNLRKSFPHKFPLATAYFNFHTEFARQRCRDRLGYHRAHAVPMDSRGFRFLNCNNKGLTDQLKGYIAGKFDTPGRYER